MSNTTWEELTAVADAPETSDTPEPKKPEEIPPKERTPEEQQALRERFIALDRDLRTARDAYKEARKELGETKDSAELSRKCDDAREPFWDLMDVTTHGSDNRLTPELLDALQQAELSEEMQKTVWRDAVTRAAENIPALWRETRNYWPDCITPEVESKWLDVLLEFAPTWEFLDTPWQGGMKLDNELNPEFESQYDDRVFVEDPLKHVVEARGIYGYSYRAKGTFTDEYFRFWVEQVVWEAVHGPEGLAAWAQSILNPQVSDDIEEDFLLDGLIARGDRQVIYSETGKGKSWLLMQIAVSVALGIHPLTGEPLEGGPRKVVYIDLELGDALMYPRLEVLCPEGKPDTLRVKSLARDRPDVTDPSTMGVAEAMIALHKPELIIIGPIKNLMGGAPLAGNSPQTARAYSALADLMQTWALRGESRRAVIFEHHTTKSGGDISGDGSLEANASHTVHLRNSGRLKMAKSRNYRAWEELGQLEQAAPKDAGDGRWSIKSSAKGKEEKPVQAQPVPTQPAEVTQETKEQRRERVRRYVDEHPNASEREISEALNIPRSTVKRDLAAIQEEIK